VLAIPLLLQAAPLGFVVGLWLPILFVCDVATVRHYPREWQPRAMVKLLPGTLLGVVLAASLLHLLKRSPNDPETKLLGAWLNLSVALFALLFVALWLWPPLLRIAGCGLWIAHQGIASRSPRTGLPRLWPADNGIKRFNCSQCQSSQADQLAAVRRATKGDRPDGQGQRLLAHLAKVFAQGGAGASGGWQPTWRASAGVGLLAGISSTLAHAAGPLVTMYFLPQKLAPRDFVGTNARFFCLLNFLKLPFLIAAGVLTATTLRYGVWLILLAPLGVALGSWLNRRVSAKWFLRIVYFFLALTGLKLGYDALRGLVG
jgi:hypothetical protein